MSFYNAMTTNDSLTANGAVTHSTSSSACLDLFFLVGASRGKDISYLVSKAFAEDSELCTRIMLWSRDVRQGAGERQHIKNFILHLEEFGKYELAKRIVDKLPELGRWDDMLVVVTSELREHVAELVDTALAKKDALCAKWMPRENSSKKDVAKWLMQYLNLTPREYRKKLAECTQVVETKMCAKEWDTINYPHVPSKAMLCYRKAFGRNDQERFAEYLEGLKKGTTKVNAGAVFPNEVIVTAQDSDTLATQMWKAMPNFLDGTEGSILPVCDVSSSMGSWDYSSKDKPITVSMGLGLYIAQRNTGPFKDLVMTFCGNPTLHKVTPLDKMTSLSKECNALYNAAPDMSTNLMGVFNLLLQKLESGSISVEDMPDTLLVISDMEFNRINNISNFSAVKLLYKEHGYPMPNIVFWNVEGRTDNIPVKMHDTGTALISGYSPSIVKSVITNECTPLNMMHKTVYVERYNF